MSFGGSIESMWRNSENSYGYVQIILHWLMALAVPGMFLLGLYMVGLGYYDAWYHRAPALHKSLGLLLAGLFVLRLGWRLANPVPRTLATRPWRGRAAGVVHFLLYLGLAALFGSGYLTAAADGHPIAVFDWFQLPALQLPVEHQEDLAGDLHQVVAWAVMSLVGIHAAAALQHHFLEGNATLKRMLRPDPDRPAP